MVKIKSLRKQQTNINMTTLERGRAGKRQVFKVENKRYDAYKMSKERKFLEKCTYEFLFVPHGRTPQCLMGNQTLACFKRSLERHFKMAHPKFNERYPQTQEEKNSIA